MKRFKTLYDTGVVSGLREVKFTKIVRYNERTFRMKYYHYYDPMKGNDIKCTVSVLTQNGDWAVIANADDFPNIPYLVPDKRDENAESKVFTMLKDFIRAVYQ